MRRIIPIILVLIMAFAFSITVLAEGEDEIVVLPPADPGEYDTNTGDYENIEVKLEDGTPDNVEAIVWAATPEWYEANKENSDEWDLMIAEDYINSDAYDENIYFDAIQFLAFVDVIQSNEPYAGGAGGTLTITNYFLGNNTLNAILQWFEGYKDNVDFSGYILITNFDYDPITGILVIYVDDFGWFSEFYALIERGVEPATAAKVLSERSPKTANNSMHAGIVMLLSLSAAAGTVVTTKKARNKI